MRSIIFRYLLSIAVSALPLLALGQPEAQPTAPKASCDPVIVDVEFDVSANGQAMNPKILEGELTVATRGPFIQAFYGQKFTPEQMESMKGKKAQRKFSIPPYGCKDGVPSSPTTAVSGPRITNYESAGNLVSENSIGCARADQVKPVYTPADLYRGVNECAQKSDFESGMFLFMLAGAYGKFDTLRVADRTAHQAIAVLQMRSGQAMTESQRAKLMEQAQALRSDPEKLSQMCGKLRAVGAPTYVPRYMIQHGMGAFTGTNQEGGLVPDFISSDAWESVLASYVHCETQTKQ